MIHLFFSIFQTIIKIILKHSIKNTKEKHDVFVSFLTPMHQLTWVTQWIGIIFEGESFQSYIFLCWLWQYGLWSFQAGGTKLERFLHKNQPTQRKLLNFEFWINGKRQNLTFKVKSSESFSFFFH